MHREATALRYPTAAVLPLRRIRAASNPNHFLWQPVSRRKKRDFALIFITLNFQSSAVRKSKMLISTNSSAGSSTQTFTNPLRLGTAPVTAGASYRITNPAGYTGPIIVDPATGVLSFGSGGLY